MKGWWRTTSLVGICCSSLCFLGLPLLLLWGPMMALDRFLNEKVMMGMLLMFFAMFAVSTISAFRSHRQLWPAIVGILGGILLWGRASHASPVLAGWLGLTFIFLSWFLDWRLMKRKGEGVSDKGCH